MSKFRKQHMTIKWHELIDRNSEVPAVSASLKEKATLVGRVGLMMLSTGSGAWRVRASMNKVCRALNIMCNADIGLLAITYTCMEGGESFTNAISINTTGVNLDRLDALEYFCDSFAERAVSCSVEKLHDILDTIQDMKGNYNAMTLALAAAAACGALTFILGGGLAEVILAFIGAGTGQFIRKKLLERHITLTANVAVSVAASSIVYMLLFKLAHRLFGLSDVHQYGYVCSMLYVIPGFPLITGGFDIAKLDMRSGLERLTYALLIIITAALAGWMVAVISGFTPSSFPETVMNPYVKYALRIAASFISVYGFSFLFNSRRKMAMTAGVIGMIANTIRFLLLDYAGAPISAAAFAAAFSAGLMASMIKKHIGYPRTTITVPSIVSMVPGMLMYRAVYYLGLFDVNTGLLWLTKAIMTLAALPLGLIAARIVTDQNFRKSS